MVEAYFSVGLGLFMVLLLTHREIWPGKHPLDWLGILLIAGVIVVAWPIVTPMFIYALIQRFKGGG